jgi:hypothetical protein
MSYFYAKQNRSLQFPVRISLRSAIDASQLPGNMLYNLYELPDRSTSV